VDIHQEIVADVAGEAVARSIQLSLEYDPNPPFASGHPDRATTATPAEVGPRYEERREIFVCPTISIQKLANWYAA
jgi:cyclohexyl-isocyanide hydratase